MTTTGPNTIGLGLRFFVRSMFCDFTC